HGLVAGQALDFFLFQDSDEVHRELRNHRALRCFCVGCRRSRALCCTQAEDEVCGKPSILHQIKTLRTNLPSWDVGGLPLPDRRVRAASSPFMLGFAVPLHTQLLYFCHPALLLPSCHLRPCYWLSSLQSRMRR